MGYGWIQNILSYPGLSAPKVYWNDGRKWHLEGDVPQVCSRMAKQQVQARFKHCNAHTHIAVAGLYL